MISQPGQFLDEPLGYGLLIQQIEIIRAQILVRASPLQKVVSNDQHGVGYSHNGPLFAFPHDQTMVLCRQIGIFCARGGPRRLAEGTPKPDASLASLSRATLPRALIIAWTKPRPAGQVMRTGKLIHIGPNFGNQSGGRQLIDTRYAVPELDGGL